MYAPCMVHVCSMALTCDVASAQAEDWLCGRAQCTDRGGLHLPDEQGPAEEKEGTVQAHPGQWDRGYLPVLQ